MMADGYPSLQGTYSLSMNTFVIDAVTKTITATTTSERLAAEEDSETQQLWRLNKLRGKDCSAPSATKKQ